MIQAIGLTSSPRKELPPAVDDVSFEVHSGRVTALLGTLGAGKTTALKLMLELQRGRGITYFRGRPLHRIAHPAREVGVVLGDVPGHPARTVRGHLRMLCAAAGLPVRRADEVLEAVGLVSLGEAQLSTLSRGMDRRLGLACALLSDPHTLVLDDPAAGLSVCESHCLHGIMRAHADRGGTVLFTTADPKEAARIADRVLTIDLGRLVADQEAADFSRTRLRPRVAVRTPHAARLGALLTKEARTARRSVEIVQEGGNRLSVYGSTCAEIGEIAFRHGVLVHQLADEIGDMGPTPVPTPPLGLAPTFMPEPTSTPELASTPTQADVQAQVDAETPTPTSPTAPSPTGGASKSTGQAEGVQEAAQEPDMPIESQHPTEGAQALAEAPQAATSRTHTLTGALETATGGSRTDTDGLRIPTTDEPDVNSTPQAASKPHTDLDPSLHTVALAPCTGSDSRPTAHIAPEAPTSPETHTIPTSRTHSTPTPPQTRLPAQDPLPALPPPITVRPAPSPLRPLRYELRRATGVGTGYVTAAAALVTSALLSVLLARIGHTPQPRLLAAWPQELPLPPAAIGAGLLGAVAFGDEFRYPALATDRGTVPRRLGLLAAKLLVAAATALLLAVLTVGCNLEMLYLVYGRELTSVPADWLSLGASWMGLVVGCAWAGVLAAGVFRSTSAGLAAVVAVPLLVVPLVRKVLEGPIVRSAVGFPMRLRELVLVQWPFGGEHYLEAAARMIAQPVAGALLLSLTTLLGAYLLTTLRSRVR
ncbi:ATP-binding cassette domain-containing protein [Streptomyces ipomoeae]|uniref:ATP-binding cassette domain-containing protein n=1 Tax=Streptomyces ipomoeae TaxID=103232 RepID=A0AAE8VW49_9ACTN|nr:ABC transporter ATP-binding protein [Streptomyces ipomoeae]TQE23057.1 ATP-binding cassette domain-containing protein [Streptomyces ipomoeae]